MLTLFLFAVFIICVAMLWNEGLWSNAITLVNITLAVLIAMNYFEPVAAFLDSMVPDYTYLWDFLAIWGLFALSMGILRMVTDLISRHRVRFKMPVEHTGRVILALWVGWIMVGFTIITLHLAPLNAHSFSGGFQKTPTSGNFFGLAPDRQLLAFVQKSSRGALSRGYSGAKVDGYHPLQEDVESRCRVFDPQSDLVIKYRNRRDFFDKGRKLSKGTGVMNLRVPRNQRASGSGALASSSAPRGLEDYWSDWHQLNLQIVGLLEGVEDADTAQQAASGMSRLADKYDAFIDDMITDDRRYFQWELDRAAKEWGKKVENSTRRVASQVDRVRGKPEAAEVLGPQLGKIEAALNRFAEAARDADS